DEEVYITALAAHLKSHGVHVTICQEEADFIRELRDSKNRWDFVITDLVKEPGPVAGEGDPHVGAQIAIRVQNMPVFLITKHYNTYDLSNLGIPSHVIVRTKTTHPAWQAADICDELRRRGLFTDPKKVFLIYGHDRGTEGSTTALEQHLKRRQLQVE